MDRDTDFILNALSDALKQVQPSFKDEATKELFWVGMLYGARSANELHAIMVESFFNSSLAKKPEYDPKMVLHFVEMFFNDFCKDLNATVDAQVAISKMKSGRKV